MILKNIKTLLLIFALVIFTTISTYASSSDTSEGTFSNLQGLVNQLNTATETKAYTFTYTGSSTIKADLFKNLDDLVNQKSQQAYVTTYSIYNDTVTLYVKKINFYAKNEASLAASLKQFNTITDEKILVLTPLTRAQVDAVLKKNAYSGKYVYSSNNQQLLLTFSNKLALKSPIEKTYTLKQLSDLEKFLKVGLDSYADKITFNISGSKLSQNEAAFNKLKTLYLTDNRFSSYSTLYSDKKIVLSIAYRLGSGTETQRQYTLANEKADKILNEIISPTMDDFSKVKAVHDYLINHTVYDKEAAYLDVHPDAITPVGPLLNGRAICSGYASAMDLFLSKLHIESHYISGSADNGSGRQLHAWNKIKLGGVYYNLDSTWDDPTTLNGESMLIYDYYLVSDRSLSADHTWKDNKQYPANTDYNYYLKNLPMIDSPESLAKLFENGDKVEFCSRNYSSDWFKNPTLTSVLFKTRSTFRYSTMQRTVNDYQVIQIEILENY